MTLEIGPEGVVLSEREKPEQVAPKTEARAAEHGSSGRAVQPRSESTGPVVDSDLDRRSSGRRQKKDKKSEASRVRKDRDAAAGAQTCPRWMYHRKGEFCKECRKTP